VILTNMEDFEDYPEQLIAFSHQKDAFRTLHPRSSRLHWWKWME
jgi:hypothetical protein